MTPTPANPPNTGINAATATVILAAGQALMRCGLKMLLSTRSGFEVVAETADGAAVAPLVRRLLPRMVLLDLGMPGVHGLEMAAALKAEFGETVKLLVLAGDLRPGALRQALLAGADGYVHSSEDGAELLRAMDALSAGRQYVSRKIAAAFLPRAGETRGLRRRQPGRHAA